MALADILGGLADVQKGWVAGDKSRLQNEELKTKMALQAIAMLQQQQQQRGMDVAGQALGQIPQRPPMAPPQGGGGMPQPQQLGGGLASGLPAPGAVKGSWFGNSPGWQDPSDSGLQASGVPVAGHPGIALPSKATLGQQFDVTFPNGRQLTLPQTDLGPSQDPRKTGGVLRGVDINSPAAAIAGYTDKTFPTNAEFIVKAHHQLDSEVGQNGAAMIQKGAPVPAIHESTSTAKEAGREIDPQQWGRSTIDDIKAAINKVAPDASGTVKLIAAGQLSKLLMPEEKMQMQMYFKEHAQAIQVELAEFKAREAEKGRAAADQRALTIETMREDAAFGRQKQGQQFREANQPVDRQALKKYIDDNPNATADDIQNFNARSRPPRSAPAMALRTFMDEFQTQNGRAPSSEEIRNFQAQNAEATSEARTIGASSANLERASNAAAALIPLVRETSNAISRTNYPDVNSLILAYETKTGDPKVVQYGEMVNSLRYLYARALAPSGQGPRVADINHFDEIFNKAWSAGQVDSALDQIQRAIGIEKGATQKTKSEILGKPADKGAAPNVPMMTREQIQQQLAPENWSKLTPEQQSAVARRVEELARGLK